jgi:hypothetical protein
MRRGMPEIPNFKNRQWQEKVSNPELAVWILDGKGNNMPSFRGRLKRAQTEALVAYLRAFGPARRESKRAPGSDFEAQFRKLDEEWEELQKQIDELKKKRRQN